MGLGKRLPRIFWGPAEVRKWLMFKGLAYALADGKSKSRWPPLPPDSSWVDLVSEQ
jgi:hypothetical protein